MCLGLRCWCLSLSRVGLAVKSSALEVIFRAREVSGRAEMSLICSSGAIQADQYTDLSQTDCMMFCFAPSTSTPPEVHQASSIVIPRVSAGRAGPVLCLGLALLFYLRTFIVLCSFHFVSVSSLTHTHTPVQTQRKEKKILNRSRETLILNK